MTLSPTGKRNLAPITDFGYLGEAAGLAGPKVVAALQDASSPSVLKNAFPG